MLVGTLFKLNYNAKAAVVVNQGGTSSGKTYAIQQVLFCLACTTPKLIITVVGQDIPNLKAGALRDAQQIHDNNAAIRYMVKSFNHTDRVFRFRNGSIMEFKSYGNAQDAKSGKRDYLFINEANGISWDIYTELALRTRIRVFIDYNPNVAFWVHERLLNNSDVQLVISDHRHNPFLDEGTRRKIENIRNIDEQLWRVYARGITGKISGLIFNNWHVCPAIPEGAKLLAYGLDFGFTNDETGCIEVYIQNGELWLNELIYETGLTNTDIADRLKQLNISKQALIIADSAEPKSIEELRRLGWRIIAASKGPDSIKNGIDILKRYRINITHRSANLQKELNNYRWRTDNDGKMLNEPVDTLNHLIDPLRYVALHKLKIASLKPNRSRLPWRGMLNQTTTNLPL